MEKVEIILSGGASYRPTEMVADLRSAAETLFFPMKTVGYWDVPTRDHICPQAQKRRACPHVLEPDDPSHVDYVSTAEQDLDAVLEITFPHAKVRLFLT